MSSSPLPRPAESLAEQFWSLARAAENDGVFAGAHERDPVTVVRRVLLILDELDAGHSGIDLTRSTVNFLMLLRQSEAAGDLSYASPEQVRGDRVDERSLVFSVGVLIFEQLTGRHPFGTTEGPRRVARMQRGELGSGVQFFPQVPPALRAVLVRSMGPFREERYASLGELREELERFAGASTVVRAAAPPRRNAIHTDKTNLLDVSDETLAVPALPKPRVDLDVSARRVGPTPSTRPLWAERLLFTAVGAFVATIAIVAVSVTRSAPQPNPVAPVAAIVVPKPVATPLPVAAPVALAVAATPSPAELEPVPPAFEVGAVGEKVATALQTCFTQRPLAAFGVGVLFNKGNRLGRRAYLAKDEPLTPIERRCVVEHVVGLDVGAAPAAATVVELRLRLRQAGTHDVHAKLAPP